MSKHEKKNVSKRCQKTKRNYREKIQQNMSNKRNNIFQIVNTHLNSIIDEQGEGQPVGLLTDLNIYFHESDDQFYLLRAESRHLE